MPLQGRGYSFLMTGTGPRATLEELLALLQDWHSRRFYKCEEMGVVDPWFMLCGGQQWDEDKITIWGECNWSPPDNAVTWLSERFQDVIVSFRYGVDELFGAVIECTNGALREVEYHRKEIYAPPVDIDEDDLRRHESSPVSLFCTYFMRDGRRLDPPEIVSLCSEADDVTKEQLRAVDELFDKKDAGAYLGSSTATHDTVDAPETSPTPTAEDVEGEPDFMEELERMGQRQAAASCEFDVAVKCDEKTQSALQQALNDLIRVDCDGMRWIPGGDGFECILDEKKGQRIKHDPRYVLSGETHWGPPWALINYLAGRFPDATVTLDYHILYLRGGRIRLQHGRSTVIDYYTEWVDQTEAGRQYTACQYIVKDGVRLVGCEAVKDGAGCGHKHETFLDAVECGRKTFGHHFAVREPDDGSSAACASIDIDLLTDSGRSDAAKAVLAHDHPDDMGKIADLGHLDGEAAPAIAPTPNAGATEDDFMNQFTKLRSWAWKPMAHECGRRYE